jgi:hypothetical protein
MSGALLRDDPTRLHAIWHLATHRSACKPLYFGAHLSALNSLKDATTLHDMAALLGYSPSGLSFLLYKVPAEQKYTTFAIPKKSGGERQIDAPVPRIKRLQKKLADLLYACAAEIEAELEATGKKKNKLSHAFRQGFSIVTNAKVHRNRRYVLNLDLKDFFPSLNFGRVRGFFQEQRIPSSSEGRNHNCPDRMPQRLFTAGKPVFTHSVRITHALPGHKACDTRQKISVHIFTLRRRSDFVDEPKGIPGASCGRNGYRLDNRRYPQAKNREQRLLHQ